jgi:hypothetical protein
MVVRQRVRDEPGHDRLGIPDRRLTDAQKGPYVGAMLFNRAAKQS